MRGGMSACRRSIRARACARPRPITPRARRSSASECDMPVRLGVAPIAWSNDDLPELGGDTPLETCLIESRDAGFSGTETGGKFPMDAAELGPLLDTHGLRLVSGWFSGRLLDGSVEHEKERMERQLATFKALGAPVMVYAETTG